MSRGTGITVINDRTCELTFQYRGERCRERVPVPNARTKSGQKIASDLKGSIEHAIHTGTFDYLAAFPASRRARRLAKDPASAILMTDLFDSYLDVKRLEIQPEQVKDHKETIKYTWLPFFESKGVVSLSQIDAVLVRAWIDVQKTTGKKRISNQLTPLRGALNYALERGLIQSNPLASVTIKRTDQLAEGRDADPFTPGEIRAICHECDPMLRHMVQCWVWSGLRFGEMAALRWSDIDFDNSRIRVFKATRERRLKTTKTRSSTRFVKMLRPARLALEAQLELVVNRDNHVWLNPSHHEHGGRYGKMVVSPWSGDKALRKHFKAACLAAGVRYRGPRHLRHTYASWQLSAGEKPIWVSRQLGHANLSQTLRTYARWINEIDPDAGERATAAIFGQPT